MLKPATRTTANGEGAPPEKPKSLAAKLIRWIFEQRSSTRHPLPPVVAYLGAVRSSKTYQVGDLSLRGFYMITPERWLLGTKFPVTLQRLDRSDSSPAGTITGQATVVRFGADGMGCEFAVSELAAKEGRNADSERTMFQASLTGFLEGLNLPSREEAISRGAQDS
jgi:hypothetical protein